MSDRLVIFIRILAGFFIILLVSPASAQPRFRLVSYNVENLFDLTQNGSEYIGYIPHTVYGWNEAAARVKYAHIASVIADAGAHVVVLSEVETLEALERLQASLLALCHPLDHGVISKHPSIVRCAVLSSFPVVERREVVVGTGMRSILRVTLDITGTPVVIYANHWKSKRGPESGRLPYARALAADIATLPAGTDYILAGDFNSDYNEWQMFHREPRLNDTEGETGINHVLATCYNDAMVTEEGLKKGWGCHYDLWMEIEPARRWSYNFFGKKGSLDHILLPAALYDNRGLSYVDGSFGRYAPDRLFQNGGIYRWQREKKGQGRHLGKGYSDHLPLYADFIVGPFVAATEKAFRGDMRVERIPQTNNSVEDLYNLPPGLANYRLKGLVVVYRAASGVVVKARHGRAIYLYRAGETLKPGWVVDLTVTQLSDYYGLREITAVADVEKRGETDLAPHLLPVDGDVDLCESRRINEVVDSVCGHYINGRLRYGAGRSVRVYTVKGINRPKNDTPVCLSRVRVGFHRTPELVVERQEQLRVGDRP
ncbi:endonuclease/exonuclease/phosphatase family protein [Desulfoluna sp.]|uniref:endonuclease/exonuclease/phosphatase family protein n=1 Tax=Desulfoluna sp. TaxID=2045199 RepID=UPI002618FE10|nr:endonuclease/exonuclease/phosphatase family protein [Desulfoluna sp.]